MPYSPPSSPVALNFFEGGYAPPSSPLTFPFSIGQPAVADGIDGAAYGLAVVSNRNLEVYPSPIDASAFGVASVEAQPLISPSGIDSLQFGPATYLKRAILIKFEGFDYNPPPIPLTFNFTDATGRPVYAFGIDALGMGTGAAFNASESLNPTGIYELAFGLTVTIYGQTRVIAGIDALSAGSPQVSNAAQAVWAEGVDTLGSGFHALNNLDQVLSMFGFDALSTGADHLVDYYLSEAYPQGFAATEWGTAWASNAVRTYYLDGIDSAAFGAATAYNRTTIIYPVPIPAGPVGTPAVGFNVQVYPFGFDAAEYGSAQLFDNSQRLPASGFASEEFGLGLVRRSFDRIEGVSLYEVLEDGEPVVYNRNQFIAPQAPETEPENTGIPTVTNFDREVFPQAFEPLRFGYQSMQRGLPPITPDGLSTLEMGVAWVSNQIRSINVLGSDMLLFDAPAVENDADAAYPPGFDTLSVAGPYVWQNRQFVRDVRVGETWDVGTPFVSDGERTVLAEGREALDAGRPTVYNYRAFVRPVGWDSYQTSTTIIRDKAIRARVDVGIQPGPAGTPTVANRNRSVYPFGPLTESMPGPRVELGDRPVYPLGISDTILGDSVRVEFLDREVRVVGWQSLAMGSGSAFNYPQPPGSQQAFAFGFDGLGFGLHQVTGNSIEPVGFATLEFGTPEARGTLLLPTGFLAFDYGIPTLIHTQYLYPEGIRDQAALGKPQMSPLTVWAPYGAPSQAIDNHGGVRGQVVGYLEYQNLGPDKIPFGDKTTWFGDAEISNLNRSVSTVGADSSRFGTATVTRTGLILVYPQGFLAFRTSFHEVLGGDKTLEPSGFSSQQFGLAVVSPPFDPTITAAVSGFEAAAWGDAWVSSRPQNINASGAESAQFGMQWVSHEYPPFPVVGFDAAALGEPWISNKVRYFDIDGFESLEVNETPPADRARVFGRGSVYGIGADSSAFGTPWVSLGQRAIGAFSVFHHVILPSPVVRSQFSAQVSGFASDTLGMPIVDVVEPGKIKARGDDSAEFGMALIRSMIQAIGISGEIGSHRIVSAIRPAGFDAAEIGGLIPVGDGDHTCGSAARAVIAQGMMTEEIGELTVG